MITKLGVQVEYPSKLGQAWVEQVHAREVDPLQLTCSMDEAGLEQSEVLAKLPDQLFEKEEAKVSAAYPVSLVTYWESPEARKLFGALDGDQDGLVAINQKIEKLHSVSQKVDGYHNVIEGRDPCNTCTQFQIFEL